KKKKSLISRVADAVAGVVSPATSAEDTTTETNQEAEGTVKITVLDKKGKPLTGVKVTLAGVSAITDNNGVVVLTGLYPGEAKGTINYKDKTQNITLPVESGTTLDDPQEANFTFNAAGGS